MKQLLLISGFLLFLVACSKDKYDYSICPTADSMTVSYVADIKPIIDFNCSFGTCHAGPPMDSTLVYDFSTYSGLKSCIGSVYNRIIRDHTDPLYMPKGLPGTYSNPVMDPCDLTRLKIWIQNGAPEN